MNQLSLEKQIEVIALLTEGCIIRATARLSRVHRDTVMRLGARIGNGSMRVLDRLFRNSRSGPRPTSHPATTIVI
jgi:hypothetical protein